MIRAGQEVTIVVGGYDSLLRSIGSPLETRITEALTLQGARLRIRSIVVVRQNILTSPAGTIGYTATIVVSSTIDRSGAQELADVVAFACYLATTYQPSEVGIGNIGPVPAPNGTTTTPGPPRSPGIVDNLTLLLQRLTAAGAWLPVLALLALVVFTVLVLGGWRKFTVGMVKVA